MVSPDQQAAPNGLVNYLDCYQESEQWPKHRLGWGLHATQAHSRSRRFSADLELSVQQRRVLVQPALVAGQSHRLLLPILACSAAVGRSLPPQPAVE